MSDPADLVTIEQVQTAYPYLDAEQIADLPQLITAASVEIATRHPYVAPAQARRDIWIPEYNREYRPKFQPIQSITRVRTDMSRVLYLTYTGPARLALAIVNDTGTGVARVCQSLQLTEQTSGVTTTIATLDFGTYTTLATLAAQVNTYSGWTAEVYQDQSDMPTLDLEPRQGPFAVKSGNPSEFSSTCYLTGFVRDLNDYYLREDGWLHFYEWRMPSYKYPLQTWGMDPRADSFRLDYIAGMPTTEADIARAAIIIIGDLLESTEFAGPVIAGSSDDASWRISESKYHFPASAERILSRYRKRVIA